MRSLPLVSSCPTFLGKRVLLRLDLNVPLEAGEIRDPYRIEKSLQTLNIILSIFAISCLRLPGKIAIIGLSES